MREKGLNTYYPFPSEYESYYKINIVLFFAIDKI